MGLFGGGSKSSTSTTNQDNRIVADSQSQVATNGGQNVKENGIGVSSGGSVAITLTDNGAIKLGTDLAAKAVYQNGQSLQDLLNVTKNIFDDATTQQKTILDKVFGNQQLQFDKTSAALTNAYQDAKGGSLMVKDLSMAVLATIAGVAFFFFMGKK